MADVETSGFVAVSGSDGGVPEIPDVSQDEDAEMNGADKAAPLNGQMLEVPEADENTADNGATDGTSLEDTVKPVPEKLTPPKPERLYFVRLPKPDLGDEDIAIEKIKAECNSLKEGCDLLLATLKVERVKQDEAKREFEAADLVFQESRAAKDKWMEQLEPLRNANTLVNEQRSQMKDNFRELSARTEEELDKMIEAIEYSMNHETHNIHEEKKLIAQLKKLEQSRPRVRTAQAAMVQLEQSKEHLDDFRQHKAELERKLDMIRAEVKEAKTIKDTRFEVLKAIRARTNQLAAELTAMRANKDSKWDEMNRLRDARKLKLDQYYDNRRFSQTVRQMLARGPDGVAEAKQQCADLNDKLITLLAESCELRAEYTSLWELQRKYSVTLADLALDSAPAKKAPLSKGVTNGMATSGKSRAQDIISALMAEADAELGLAPSVATTTAAKSLLPTSNGHAAAPAMVPGHDELPKPRAPPKARAEKAKALPPPPDIENVFEAYVPPPRATPESANAAKLTAEQQKLAIREEQRQKAAEAEERKKKREEAKLKKIGKASELAKLKEEEEELKAELERERIRREADEQRRRDARRKEEAKRRGATTKPGKGKHSAQAKEPVQAKKPKVKLGIAGRALKFGKDNGAVIAIGAVVAVLAAVLYLIVQMG